VGWFTWLPSGNSTTKRFDDATAHTRGRCKPLQTKLDNKVVPPGKVLHQIKLELLASLVRLFTMDNVAVPMKVEALACMTFKNLKI
jgi:hypothetical protein